VAIGTRSVRAVEAAEILPRAHFHAAVLSDALATREGYFEMFWNTLGPRELVFFDPDNGLEVTSVPKGRRNSSKYLYWDELTKALGGERSVCVYQHFPRRPRASFLVGLLERMTSLATGHAAFAVTSPWVAYLLCAPAKRADALRAAAAELVDREGSLLTLGPRIDASP
jgi:hypothetical protein